MRRRRRPSSKGEECASFEHCCLDYEGGGDGLARPLGRGRSLTHSLGLSSASSSSSRSVGYATC